MIEKELLIHVLLYYYPGDIGYHDTVLSIVCSRDGHMVEWGFVSSSNVNNNITFNNCLSSEPGYMTGLLRLD